MSLLLRKSLSLNQEIDLDLRQIRSGSGTTMVSYRPSVFDCSQSDGSVETKRIVDNDCQR